MKHRIYPIRSVDDKGWYAEVCDLAGKTVHTTDVFKSRQECIDAAKRWFLSERK